MTVLKKVFSILIICAILAGVCSAELLPEDYIFPFDKNNEEIETAAENSLAPNCRSALLMEASSGKVLFEKNIDEKLPIASVTKVMALLLVMEALDSGVIKIDEMVTVTENAAGMGGSQAYMEPGEKMTVDEMLKAVVVSSANDGAVALGEHIAGSEEGFVNRMNARAKELGMTSTEFLNITGLDNTQVHYSTARDVAIMSRELLRHELIFNYTTIWIDTIRGGKFGLSNTNKLIRFYPGANGLKTGSTSKAKFCISAAAKKDNMQLIAVILASPTSDDRFSSAKQLFNYGFANYAIYSPQKSDIPPLKVWGGKVSECKVEFESGGMLVSKGQETKITEEIIISPEVYAPVDKGQKVGKIIYSLDGKAVAENDIIAAESIERMTFGDIFKSLISRMLL